MSLTILLPEKLDQLNEDENEKDLDNFLINLDSVPKRKLIFFDEALIGYIRFESSLPISADFNNHAYLNVAVIPGDLDLVNQSSSTKSESGRTYSDLSNGELASNNYSIMSIPITPENVRLKGSTSINDKHYVIWKFEIPIGYPRTKFSDPKILFSCFLNSSGTPPLTSSFSLSSVDNENVLSNGLETNQSSQKLLTDLRPDTKRNLFEELNNQVSLKPDQKYFLSSKSLSPEPESQQNGNSSVENGQSISETIITSEDKSDIGYNDQLSTKLCLPVSASLIIKLKSTKPAGRNNILLATLNIESSEEFLKILKNNSTEDSTYNDYYFNILDLSMEFKYGIIENFQSSNFKFPIRYKLADSINMTYKLINNDYLDKELKSADGYNNSNSTSLSSGVNVNSSKPIGIKLVLQKIKYFPELDSFQPVSNIITTNWSPYLDFSIVAPPINSSLKSSTTSQSQYQSQSQSQIRAANGMSPRKSALMNSMYKSKGVDVPNSPLTNPSAVNSSTSLGYHQISPTSSFTTSNTMASFNVNSKKLNKSLSSTSSVTVNLTTNNNSTLAGLKLTFKGKLNVSLGEIITWKLQAINNSPNKLNLSLIVQNPINFNPVYSASSTSAPISSNNFSSSNLLATNEQKKTENILVYNKLQLHNLYSSVKLDTNGIIILDNDVRIGPIDSHSVFETDIKLIGISKGIYNLDGIKIFDISSGDGIDFGKLVEVFVV